MVRLIIFLVAAVALSLVAAWFANHPGVVELTWEGMRVETSVAVLIVGAVVLAALVTIVFEILRVVGAIPGRVVESRRQSRREQGYHALSQGMVAAAAGDVGAARALAKRADKLLDHTPSTLLLSAQTAQLEGDEGTARLSFQRMLKHQETEFLGLRGLLAQAIKDDDRNTALRLAKKAYLRRPDMPWVLTTLFDLQTREQKWRDALSTVGDMARHKVIDRATAARRRAILFHQQATEQRAAGKPYEALMLAQKAHKLVPDFAPVAVLAADVAEQVNRPKVARKILETTWRNRPHPSIVNGYLGLVEDPSPMERFRQVEKLYEMNPDKSHEAEVALAEAAIAAKQWGPAREALEKALKLERTASVYRLLAELEQGESGNSEKVRYWLSQAMDALPDPAWLCASTGEPQAEWAAFGPDGRFDSLRWGTPPKFMPLLEPGGTAELIPPTLAMESASARPGTQPEEVPAVTVVPTSTTVTEPDETTPTAPVQAGDGAAAPEPKATKPEAAGSPGTTSPAPGSAAAGAAARS